MEIGDLPEDVIVEILSRLPVKSLMRSRCVCKFWCAIVTDPVFVKIDLARYSASKNLSLIITREYNSRDSYLYSADLDTCRPQAGLALKSPHHATKVVGCCNGLLCILSYSRYETFVIRNHHTRIFIWNPSIGRQQMLPITPIEHPNSDPSEFRYFQKVLYGFGHDPTTDDYKLVRVVQFNDACDWEVKVYSLSTNSWRRIEDMPSRLSYIPTSGFLANSALHWVAERKKGSNTATSFIISFDYRDEGYREVPLPDFTTDNKFQLNVGVLGGQLCALCFFSVGKRFRIEIWVMKDYGIRDSWVKQFSIGRPLVIKCVNDVRPICYLKNGEVMLERDSRSLILYNPIKNRIRYLKSCGIPVWRQRPSVLDIGIENIRGESHSTQCQRWNRTMMLGLCG